MKKKIYLLSTALMLAFSTAQLKAATVVTEPVVTKEVILTDAQKEVKLQAIKERVEEIKAMDKSQLSKEQKQELKSELKTMKTQAKAMGGGIYLSVGAIIIIILLLIIIL